MGGARNQVTANGHDHCRIKQHHEQGDESEQVTVQLVEIQASTPAMKLRLSISSCPV
jgi:hypothetical protein